MDTLSKMIANINEALNNYVLGNLYEVVTEAQNKVLLPKMKTAKEVTSTFNTLLNEAKSKSLDEIRLDIFISDLKNHRKGCPLKITGVSALPVTKDKDKSYKDWDNYFIIVWVTGPKTERIMDKWTEIFSEVLPKKGDSVHIVWTSIEKEGVL